VTNLFSLSDPRQRKEGITEAKHALSASGLVVMPTDTVYGLAADAFDAVGVRRLLRAKGRGRDMPTPVLIASGDTLRALATNVSAQTRELAAALWPGALTLICRQQPTLRWDIGDSRGTVALRVPNHPDAIELLLETGPLAVSSANITGSPAATTVQQAQDMLKDAVDVYLDGGPTSGPIPSTIVDATGDVLRVMRLGLVSLAQLREVVADIEGPEDRDEEEVLEGFASPDETSAGADDTGPDDGEPAERSATGGPHGSTRVDLTEDHDGADPTAKPD
jgi:L-threonylcarbamoyladenylate synthase